MRLEKTKKNLINRIYDTFYRWLDFFQQVILERLDEEYTALVRDHAHRLIAGLTSILSLLVLFKREEKNRFLQLVLAPFKLCLGIAFAGVLLVIFLTVTLIFGALAGIVGLRNLSEYQFKEQLAAWLIVLLIMMAAPFLFSEYLVSRIQFCLLYALILIGFCFLYGQCGIMSLGQATFVFLGAYFTAWLHLGTFFRPLPLLPSVFIGGCGTAIIGILLGLPSLRVRDSYLVVITLVFGQIVLKLFRSKYLSEYSGASAGGLLLESSSPPQFLSFLTDSQWVYYSILFPGFLLIYAAHNILRKSQIGRALRIIKCDVEVSTILGVPVFRYKLFAFAISAFYAGCAGGLFFLLIGSISPESFGFQESLDYMIASVIGGPEGILGAVVGGAYLTLQSDMMRKVADIYPQADNLMRAASGVILIIAIYLFPSGIAGRLSGWVKSKVSGPRFRGAYRVLPPPDYDFLNQRKPPKGQGEIDL